MEKRYNIGFETIDGTGVGIVTAAPHMDEAIRRAREQIGTPTKPGSEAQACDNGPGDERFYRLRKMVTA